MSEAQAHQPHAPSRGIQVDGTSEAKGLKFVQVKGLEIRRRLHLIRRADRPLSAFARNFLRTTVQSLRHVPLHKDVEIVLPKSFDPESF